MSPTTNKSLIDLPKDIQYELVKYLTVKDLSSCLLVSHAWKNIFGSDILWEPIAKRLGIKKLQTNSIHQFLIETPLLFNCLPISLKNYLVNDYKSLIRQKFLLEEENIRQTYPAEFLEVFGGAKAIQRLPAIEITFDDLIHENNGFRDFYRFKDEHFSSPVVRATLKRNDNSEMYIILFRIINNTTGKIYRDAISFHSIAGMRFFETDATRREQRVICPCYSDVTKEKLNRLQRLIQREPVGIIVEQERYAIAEGLKTTSDKKSVLELC